MVAQVLAYARQVLDHLDAEAFEMLGRPHAGKHQKLGRGNCPAADDNLVGLHRENLPAAFGFNTHGPLSLEQNTPRRDAAP